MPRIDANQRLLTLKLVYYGPALGGKTTNLRALHALADPTGEIELRSLDTEGDRTLFFDLLPLDLGEAGGFRIQVRLFTVPGQVHYNGTRRIVLTGADGLVFVADSTPGRFDANRQSLGNLCANLAAVGIAPGTVPIVLQANKRDAADAAPLEDVEASLGLEQLAAHRRTTLRRIVPASALTGEGVVDTYDALLRATLAVVHRTHGLDALGLTREKLGEAVTLALAPLRERVLRLDGAPPAPAIQAPDAARAETTLDASSLLGESVRQAMDLAEALGDQSAMSRALQRRVTELETINELSRVLMHSLDPDRIARAAVTAARAALPGGAASLLVPDRDGILREGTLDGLPADPLLTTGRPPVAFRIQRAGRAVAIRDLERQVALGDPDLCARLAPFCTAAAAPLRMPSGWPALLVAYGSDPDAPAGEDTTRFLGAVAAQASLALQNADRHAQLLAHRARLEEEVAARTAELRIAHDELGALSKLKDRVLSCVNHELRTPVTKLLAAAQVLERIKPGSTPPPAMFKGIVDQARHLAGLLDQVLAARSLVVVESEGESGGQAAEEARGVDLARSLEAVAFSFHERAAARRVVVHVDVPGHPVNVLAPPASVSLVLAQVVDNAVKFTKPGTEVRVELALADARRARVVVRDQGAGVRPEDVARIFEAFDQGSADALVAKPNGLGLGLAIARRLARRLGGDVGLEPSPAGGSAFWIELPLATAAVAA